MKTINQINAYCRENDNIQLYVNTSKNYLTCSQEYHKRYFQEIGKHCGSVCGTFYYCNAMKYLNLYVHGKKMSGYCEENYIRTHVDYEKNKLYIIAQVEETGVRIQINYLFGSLESIYFKPKSNLTFTEENVIKLSLEYIERFLVYPEGVFKNIQLLKNYDKKESLKWYKLYMSMVDRINRLPEYDMEATEKQLIRVLRKKHNIELINSWDIWRDYRKLRKEYYKKRTKINANLLNLSYSDIEDYCYGEGLEVDEETILQAIDELV